MRYYDYHDYSSRISLSRENFPKLSKYFDEWLIKYTNYDSHKREKMKFKNSVVYDIHNRDSYIKCCLDFISGMTDNFALKVYEEIISF